MAQIDNNVLIGIFAAIIGVYVMFSRFLMNKKNDKVSKGEFEAHKNSVQYKDNCKQIVLRIEASINSLSEITDERFKNIATSLKNIEEHIKNNH